MRQKTKIAFFDTEPWEKKYLEDKTSLKKLQNIELKFFEKPLSKGIIKQIKDIEVLVVFIHPEINREIINKLPKLKFIAAMSAGFDHIDLEVCKKQRIKVSNVPCYGVNAVAEHTFALILALVKKIPESIERTRKCDFSLKNLRNFDLREETLGIIGLGRIGTQVARIANGFEMKIIAYDIKKDLKLARELRVKYVNLDYLLSHSKIITLHAPYNSATHHLIDKKNIKRVKKGALIINTARGGLIQTEALLIGLKKKILDGIGLDVLEEEGFLKEERELLTKPFQKKCDLRVILQSHFLREHPRVIITPHNAFNSQEALEEILDITVDNIRAYLNKKPINLVC